MRILGIDPGLATIGYGIVENQNNCTKALDYGIISTEASMDMPDRLVLIYELLNELIDTYKPEELAIEEIFFSKNVKTAITVGHARGVQILACKLRGLRVYEYTPLQVKQAVTGYGRAEKAQVQEMVKILLGLRQVPKPDDAADALALAITHSHSQNFKEEFRMR